jgi:hypothetical protein
LAWHPPRRTDRITVARPPPSLRKCSFGISWSGALGENRSPPSCFLVPPGITKVRPHQSPASLIPIQVPTGVPVAAVVLYRRVSYCLGTHPGERTELQCSFGISWSGALGENRSPPSCSLLPPGYHKSPTTSVASESHSDSGTNGGPTSTRSCSTTSRGRRTPGPRRTGSNIRSSSSTWLLGAAILSRRGELNFHPRGCCRLAVPGGVGGGGSERCQLAFAGAPGVSGGVRRWWFVSPGHVRRCRWVRAGGVRGHPERAERATQSERAERATQSEPSRPPIGREAGSRPEVSLGLGRRCLGPSRAS